MSICVYGYVRCSGPWSRHGRTDIRALSCCCCLLLRYIFDANAKTFNLRICVIAMQNYICAVVLKRSTQNDGGDEDDDALYAKRYVFCTRDDAIVASVYVASVVQSVEIILNFI